MNRHSYEPPTNRQTLERLYVDCGHSQAEIAAMLDVSLKRVQTAMRHFGIRPRRQVKREQIGATNANWRGGRIRQGEYVYIKAPKHPCATAKGYVAEHILIATRKYGRSPTRGEVIHHINMRKHDNRPANLVIVDRPRHAAWHRQMESIVGELFAEGLLAFSEQDGYHLRQ